MLVVCLYLHVLSVKREPITRSKGGIPALRACRVRQENSTGSSGQTVKVIVRSVLVENKQIFINLVVFRLTTCRWVQRSNSVVYVINRDGHGG